MPHSSGGGSHGGGSHGGSRGGNSSPRVSRRPYAGARRYIYYYPGTSRSEYLYCNGPRTNPDSTQLKSTIFISLFLLILSFFILKSALAKPEKADLNSYDSEIRIEDQTGLLDDTALLQGALSDFRALTGVAPAIEVVTHSDWKQNYADLESFAYNEYLRLFDDEKHWLFVFSVPESTGTGFEDWAWEGMIGDDLGSTIFSSAEENMTQIIQKYMVRNDVGNISDAIACAFREFSETVMEPPTGFSACIPAVVPFLFAMFLLLGAWSDYKNRKKLANAYPVGYDAPKEHNCAYCGCMYVEGTVSVCPHCGAPIPASEPSKEL